MSWLRGSSVARVEVSEYQGDSWTTSTQRRHPSQHGGASSAGGRRTLRSLVGHSVWTRWSWKEHGYRCSSGVSRGGRGSLGSRRARQVQGKAEQGEPGSKRPVCAMAMRCADCGAWTHASREDPLCLYYGRSPEDHPGADLGDHQPHLSQLRTSTAAGGIMQAAARQRPCWCEGRAVEICVAGLWRGPCGEARVVVVVCSRCGVAGSAGGGVYNTHGDMGR